MKNKNILSEKKQYTTILHHGTSTAFLRSIFKTGLDPNPSKRSMGDPAQFGTGLESYHGIYFTKSFHRAVCAADYVARVQHKGSPMVVTIQYVQGSGSVDEDDVIESIIRPILYYKYKIFDNIDRAVNDAVTSIESGEDRVALTQKSIALLKDVFEVTAEIVFRTDNPADHKRALENLSRDSSIITANREFRSYFLKFMNSLKIFTRDQGTAVSSTSYTSGQSYVANTPNYVVRSKNVRIPRQIGFSGKTRIIKIENALTGEIYYEDKNPSQV